ncbi:MAG TPA: MlaE family lipid ABC transporter permease subunit [Candidatus Competibacteraceae bacterium]|nr:MlaE family lipid ABC transporter permease subunit [Candidatus Competibacteraceae bacterium]
MTETTPISPARIEIARDGIRCRGAWTVAGIEGLEGRLALVDWPLGSFTLDGSAIEALDTTGALQLARLLEQLAEQGRAARLVGLAPADQALLELVQERRHEAGQRPPPPVGEGFLAGLGRQSVAHLINARDFLAFIGEVSTVIARTLAQPWRLRGRALLAVIESAGVNALPILALLTFLMGVVIAYQGGQQLKYYGANIFIVELVCLTMLRELAPLLTAIIVAGRTGSAFTAEIGTMRVTEEVDALRTIGISPLEILVLPKLGALLIALPLLALFADFVSVFGGMVMAQFLLGVTFAEFLDRVPQAVSLTSFLIGIGKAPVFAAIIALVGCYQGFQVQGGADSVGRQTTVSVVQSIFLVIVADAFFSVLFGWLGI